MACDLAGLNAGAADLLPPRDVRAAERVRAEPEEVQTLGCRRLLERVTDAGVPSWLLVVVLLWKDPGVRTLVL